MFLSGVVMLRLSVLLVASMFVALLIAGEDKGQMRPGLAAAVAEGRQIEVIEQRDSTPVVVVDEPAPEPVAEPAAAEVVQAAYIPPDALPEPEPATRKVPAEPVFTLSALPSIGNDQADVDAALQDQPEVSAGGGEVWYVSGSSVNVRQGPSTDTSVVGKLRAGEAVTVIAQEDGDWVQIVIEGDGIEGYVAARFLTPDAP